MSEESRLGRESIKTAYALQQLIEAGVRVFFYLSDGERKLNTAMDKLMGSIIGYASENEREKAQERTYDAMLRKAKAGHVTGGCVFGYDNIDVDGPIADAQGRTKRSHVELKINEAEADVVRRIFMLYAAGHGFMTIAKMLNAEGAICPRPRPAPTKPRGWASSSVRAILLRPLYRGEIVWGRTKKRLPSGRIKAQRRPEKDWHIIEVKHLQIVSDALWDDAQNHWNSVRQRYLRATNGRLHGRPTHGFESRYLLTGFTECKTCKGALHIRSRSHGKARAYFYACVTHYQRGPESCPEPMLVPMALLDQHVLATLERDILEPVIIVKAIEKALRQLEPCEEDEPEIRREIIRKELAHIEAELARSPQPSQPAAHWRRCSWPCRNGRHDARTSRQTWLCSTARR
jgi:DNA invertase Pin-like site-specific DNA recombinase